MSLAGALALGEIEMDLRLIYNGPLPSERGGAMRIKHDIRRQLRSQLHDHVRRQPALSHLVQRIRGELPPHAPPQGYEEALEPDWAAIGRRYRFGDQEFVPIAVGAAHMICHLNILFLRRETTESLISKPKDEYGGDLDNRLKIFLDALRAPQEEKEVPSGITYEQWERGPFYCLLEDDSLITKLTIEADTWPGLYHPGEEKHVQIITTATLKLTTVAPYNFLLAT